MPTVTLKCAGINGEMFEVEEKVAKVSMKIKTMLEEEGGIQAGGGVISLPLSGYVLKEIIEWAKHHQNDPEPDEDEAFNEWDENEMSEWDAEFLNVDLNLLMEYNEAAGYLEIPLLEDLTIRKIFQIINFNNNNGQNP